MPRNRRRRSRRRGPNPAVVATLVMVPLFSVAALAGAGFLLLDRQATPTAVANAATDAPADPASDVNPSTTNTVGVIIDPSGSNGGVKNAQRVLAVLAKSVKTWAGDEPTNAGATAGSPGLDLTVRAVTSNSYAASGQVAHVTIPAVPGLDARPDLADDEAFNVFLGDLDRATAAWKQASSAARAAAPTLATADIPRGNSEIAGAVSAMAQVLPDDGVGPRRIVIVSDLIQAGEAPNIAGDLSGVEEVLAIQRCDKGENKCAAARNSFTDLVTGLGGPIPTFVRIETLASSLPAFLLKESQS